jgi:hypothetical protein
LWAFHVDHHINEKGFAYEALFCGVPIMATGSRPKSIARTSPGDSQVDLFDLVSFRELASLLPQRRGKPVPTSSLVKWATAGIRAGHGERLRLRAVKLPQSWMSKPQWLAEFVAGLTDARIETNRASITPSR